MAQIRATGDYVSPLERAWFLEQRIQEAGTPNVDMADVSEYFKPGREIGNKDSFDRLFDDPKTHYYAHYTGKRYAAGSGEVVSMGLQAMYNDPVGFARKDPEYFKFIASLLDGTLSEALAL